MQRLNPILFLLIISLVVISCKKSEPSFDLDKMYSTYDVTYDENTNETTVYAQFRNSETAELLKLDDEALLKYDSDTMKYIEDISSYAVEFSGGQFTTGTINLRLETGEVFTNTIPPVEPIFFEPILDTLSQTENIHVLWLGTPLGENQRVDMLVGDEEFFQTVVGSTTVYMDQALLRKIDLGPVTAHLERTVRVPVQEGTAAGGQITGKYRALDVVLEIVP